MVDSGPWNRTTGCTFLEVLRIRQPKMVAQGQQSRAMVLIPTHRHIYNCQPVCLRGGLVPGELAEHVAYQRTSGSFVGWSDSWDCLLRGWRSVLALGSILPSISWVRNGTSSGAHGRFDCTHYF